jgi:stringent starvation protein B
MSTLMTSSRPYLVRALYEWILDNGCTPHVVVDALIDGVEVPQEHVKDGQIVLNVSPVAVQDLIIDDHYVSFNGRFAGVSRRVLVPIGAMLGIYARENGEGMMFKAEILPEPEPPAPSDSSASGTQSSSSQKKPALRLVK